MMLFLRSCMGKGTGCLKAQMIREKGNKCNEFVSRENTIMQNTNHCIHRHNQDKGNV